MGMISMKDAIGIVAEEVGRTKNDQSRLSESITEISKYNAVDLLSGQLTFTNRTHNGVAFTWNGNECTVKGTATSNAFCNVYADAERMPQNVFGGKQFRIIYNSSDVNVRYVLTAYLTDGTTKTYYFNKNTIVTLPTNIKGMVLRLQVDSGKTVDTLIKAPIFLNTATNAELDERVNSLEKSPWYGKLWYSFGTSMSDMNMDGATGNNPNVGSKPWVLRVDVLSGMNRINKAIGSGGIIPALHADNRNVKINIMECPWDVDLVTIEIGANDWYNAYPLGKVGDKSDDTFIGNFTQCIEYLVLNTRAKVVCISVPWLTYTDATRTTRMNPYQQNMRGETWRDVIEAQKEVCKIYGVEYIDAEAMMPISWRNKETVKDQIHLTAKGGAVLGELIWSKLKHMIPCPVAFAKEV